MLVNNNPDKKLIPFLRNLANSIESEELIPSQLQRIGEFFMSYQFQEQAEKDNQNNNENTKEEFSKQDLIKFLSLGWYVYQILLRNETIPCS